MNANQWAELASQPYRDALRRDAEIEALKAQIDQYIADAIVRAHKQCIAIEALKRINELSLYYLDREIAQKALADIEGVQP